MEPLGFVLTVVLVSASGALAPGPLFFANLAKGSRSGAKSGIVFSVAHTLIEFTLVILVALGLLIVMNELVKIVIGVAGGVALIAFGAVQIYDSLKSKSKNLEGTGEKSYMRLFFLGLAFTGLNPFFLVWWLTAGAQLIFIALEYASLAGVLFMYVCHVWIDYVWLTATAYFSQRGMKIAKLKSYRIVMAFFGVVLIYFGLTFLINSMQI